MRIEGITATTDSLLRNPRYKAVSSTEAEPVRKDTVRSRRSRSRFSLGTNGSPGPTARSLSLTRITHTSIHPSNTTTTSGPPRVPLTPVGHIRTQFGPLTSNLVCLIIFINNFININYHQNLSVLLPSIGNAPFIINAFISGVLTYFLFTVLARCVTATS